MRPGPRGIRAGGVPAAQGFMNPAGRRRGRGYAESLTFRGLQSAARAAWMRPAPARHKEGCRRRRELAVGASSLKNAIPALAALGSLCLGPDAAAIAVRIVEDSPARFTFDVVWGSELPPFPDDQHEISDATAFLRAADFESFGLVTAESRFGLDTFDILFDWVDARAFADAVLASFEGSQSLPLEGEPFGARFVYGEAYDAPAATAAPVPDHGRTVLFLAGSSLALGWMARVRRTPTARPAAPR